MAKSQDRAADFDWDDLRVFLALARGKTLASAASRLGVDPTTIGRRLTALESALGATLFERGRDGVVLTAAGEQLMPQAEETERGAAGLYAAANNLESTVEGVVRLSTPPVIAESLVVPLLRELSVRHPALRLELDASVAFADLTRREADLALRLRRPASGDLVMTRLLETTYGLFGAPGLIAELGVVSALSAVPFVGWTEELAGYPPAEWAREHVEPSSFVLRAGSLGTQIAAAREGVGVALLPAALAERYGLLPIRCKRAAQKATLAAPREEIWLVGHRALRTVPRVAAVWDLLATGTPRLVAERRPLA